MPKQPPKVCSKCRSIHPHKKACPKQEGARGKIFNDSTRVTGGRWRTLKRIVRQDQGGVCAFPGCDMLVEEVDHIIPRSVRPDLMYDRDNLQGLCKEHHSQKTKMENGG